MDFGIAKATQRLGETQDGVLKGKLSYTAPECFLHGSGVADARSDVFSAGVVFWGLLAGRKLFNGVDVGDTMAQVMAREPEPLTEIRDDVPPELDLVIRRALARDPEERFASAREFEDSVQEAVGKVASQRVIGQWVERLARAAVASREAEVQAIEQTVVLDPARSVDIAPLPFAPQPATRADSIPSEEATRRLGKAASDVTTVLPIDPTPAADVALPGVQVPVAPRYRLRVVIGAVFLMAIGGGFLIARGASTSSADLPMKPAETSESTAATLTLPPPPSAVASSPPEPAAEPEIADSSSEARPPSSTAPPQGSPARPKKGASRGYFPPRP
jgi:hypothetical protein